MSVSATKELVFRTRRRDWIVDLGAAALAALAAFTVYAAGGFEGLSDARGDNDALLRLVQVRDLIAGQGWFDLNQYRMGLEGGFTMHWSRIVDAPIAAIVMGTSYLVGDTMLAERIASVLWPLLIYATAVFLILRAAGTLGGSEARLPALIVGAVTLHIGAGLFSPGSLDHHNLQLILTLTLVLGLFSPSNDGWFAYGAGASAALMLAIGMETLPYVAIGGLCVAGRFLIEGATEGHRAARFGTAFGTTALFCFLLTVPYTAWFVPQCDAFSVAQFAVASLAGFGLAAIASMPATAGGLVPRVFALGGLGVAAAVLVGIAFPQCLGDPFAGLDPRLRELWLDSVSEAQSVRSIFVHDPIFLAAYYATPLVALGVLACRFWQRGFDWRHGIIAAFIAGAFLVSLWQVRGAMFSIPLAVIPLSGWIGEQRTKAKASGPAVLKMLGAWLISLNLVWYTAAGLAEDLVGSEMSTAKGDLDEETCYKAGDYDSLAALPADTVLVVSNLGASVLRHTPHRTLAGPYHRNVEGNLVTLDIFMGGSAAAESRIRELNIGLIALCPGNSETGDLAMRAPDSLIAELSRNLHPEWLEVMPGTEAATLRLYRVKQR